MPIEQKHYGRDGKYTGKTVTKTQEEINSENAAADQLWAAIFKYALIGLALWGILEAGLWIIKLLSNPAALPLPHKLFAYYYHYFFKFIFLVFEVLKPILVFAYKVATEYLDFVKDLTRFPNLNLVLWIASLIIYAGLLLFVSSMLVSAIGGLGSDFWGLTAGIAALATFVPASLWIFYYLLERIFMWLFR